MNGRRETALTRHGVDVEGEDMGESNGVGPEVLDRADKSASAPDTGRSLEELESVIERGLKTFLEVGYAIREIRDQKLYMEHYPNFDSYCRNRWGWTKGHAGRVVQAADTAEALGESHSEHQFENLAQARAVYPHAREDPEAAREVWEELNTGREEGGAPLSSSDIKQAFQERREYKDYLSALPEETRGVLEQADENDPKQRNVLRNSSQLNHLASIADKRGDEVSAEVAESVLSGRHSSTFESYNTMKDEVASGDDNSLQVHYSSASSEWLTPPKVLERVVAAVGPIDLDPCSDEGFNVEAARHFTFREDGLDREWGGEESPVSVYMNPPYGDGIGRWVDKLLSEYESGRVRQAVALLPSRTDTRWFAKLAAYPRCFIRGRIRFSGTDSGAPFPSAAFYIGDDPESFSESFRELGDIYVLSIPSSAEPGESGTAAADTEAPVSEGIPEYEEAPVLSGA